MSKGVSGVVSVVFLSLVMIAIIGLIVYFFNTSMYMSRATQDVLLKKTESTELATSLSSTWMYNDITHTITVNITNSCSRPVIVTRIVVIYPDKTFELTSIRRAVLEPGETKSFDITVKQKPLNVIVGTATATGAGSAIASKEYVPPIPSTIAAGNYSIAYAPTVFSSYTVAALGYSSIPKAENITGYAIELGTLISGDKDSLTAIDNNYMTVDSIATGYITRIEVKNNVNEDLRDYQIKLVLNDTNWDGWGHVRSDGSDIYFIDENGRPLHFFIEEFNAATEYAVIWVRVPLIPASGSTVIYMRYGYSGTNPHASYNDPYKTFFIYENITAGIEEGALAGTAYYDTNNHIVVLTENLGSQLGYLYYNKVPTSPTGFYARFYFKTHGGIIFFGADAVWLGAYDTSYQGTREDVVEGGYHFTYDEYQDRIAFTKSTEDNGPSIAESHVTNIDNGHVHLAEIYFWYNHSAAHTRIYYDGNLKVDATDTGVQQNVINGEGMIVLGGRTGGLTNYHELWYNITIAKYVYPEPTVTIGSSESCHEVVIDLGWSDIAPASLSYLYLNNSNVNTTTCIMEVYENSTGSWSIAYSDALSTGSLPDAVPLNRYFDSDTIGVKLRIIGPEPFELKLDYTAVGIRVLDRGSPLILVACNNTNKLYVYRVTSSDWIIVDPGGTLINQSICFDYSLLKFLILNATGILEYDPLFNTVTLIRAFDDTVQKPEDSAFILPLNGYLLYAVGGGSDQAYIFDEGDWSIPPASTTLPKPVNPYTCTAYSENGVGYIMFGGTGDIYSVTVKTTGGSPALDSSLISVSPSTPTLYPVGLAYGGGNLWVISKGGSISYINVLTGEVKALSIQPPYYPMSEGDRLVFTEVNGHVTLYHIRSDGTSEIWTIRVT